MEQYKQQIIDRGYSIVEESEFGISFVNESAKFCVILLKQYWSQNKHDAEFGHSLHANLKKKFIYAEKCTILVINALHPEESRTQEEIERDEYFFLKMFPENIQYLPKAENKSTTINFSPMKSAEDKGDYTVDPFDEFDGKCSGNFLKYLSQAKDGDVVKYPKIVDNRFFRYWADKLYTIKMID